MSLPAHAFATGKARYLKRIFPVHALKYEGLSTNQGDLDLFNIDRCAIILENRLFIVLFGRWGWGKLTKFHFWHCFFITPGTRHKKRK